MTHRQLGCASDYAVFVTGPDYRTRVGGVGWSEIQWSRVLDEISTASVFVPDSVGGVRCCIPYGGIKPWLYGLSIERNGEEVWTGPVTNVTRRRDNVPGISISCHDILVRLARRLATRDDVVEFKQADAGAILGKVINDSSRLTSDPWILHAPDVVTGVRMDRDLVPLDFEYAHDVVRELMEAAVDAYVHTGTLYVWQPGLGWVYPRVDGAGVVTTLLLEGDYNSHHELEQGLFTELAYSAQPTWSIDGMEQSNSWWEVGADSGEAGARRYWLAEYLIGQQEVGVLDHVRNSTLYRGGEDGPVIDDAVFQRAADSALALHAFAPVVIEGGALSERAPIDIQDIRPGALWTMDVFDNCWGQLLTQARLKRVSVTVRASDNGIEEQVAPTLQPPGFEDF